jgi:hypothetical protein
MWAPGQERQLQFRFGGFQRRQLLDRQVFQIALGEGDRSEKFHSRGCKVSAGALIWTRFAIPGLGAISILSFRLREL